MEEEKIVLKGYVDHIIYENRENNYKVLALSCDKTDEKVVGIFPGVGQGDCLYIEGFEEEHPSFGTQIHARMFEIVLPDDSYSIQKYLGSGAIKGVGEKLAERIVKRFGENTFRIMEEEPLRLAEIKGISERIAQQIAIQVCEKKDMRRAMLFLQDYGMTDKLAVKVYEYYGDAIYDVLKTNPYRIAEEIDGVGFKTADEIALGSGILINSEYRIRCGVVYALTQAMMGGHTCLPQEKLIEESVRLLSVDADDIQVEISNLVVEHRIMMRQEEEKGPVFIYAPSAFRAESECAYKLEELNVRFFETGEDCMSAEESRILDKIAKIEDGSGIVLDEMQRRAVLEAIQNGVMILTGGPGTGKTTTIHIMLRYFEEEQMEIALAAPTGRAAKRMTEACGMEARTIHRLLEVNGGGDDSSGRFGRNEEYPLEADVIIVDEMSMVDIFLFKALLAAIPKGVHLIMVGDVDQLPSVGPGCVLKDVIDSGCYATVALQNIFRQAAESEIVMNAHRIHDGKEPVIHNKESRDFYFLERSQPVEIYNNIIMLVSDMLPRYVGIDPMDVQVLTPMRKGALGVEELNAVLQKYLNPASMEKREHAYGDLLFREGDKVMQTKNNYKLEWEIRGNYNLVIKKGEGIFNGDVGIVREINDYASFMIIEFDDGRIVQYPYENLDELELAYAITIHKSQGSEYPAVVIPLFGVPGLLIYRNLLYTGVTRAKSCVTLIGSSQIMNQMILNENKQRRYTGLYYRIKERERLCGQEHN
ncbi:MAG: ATP-dependent RecD-like DNA helicase [Lachnospiraceae bacterium]|nr:ATP-dependent RecD-like DNA helicase [Lachnospiraceae bacterium]MDD5853214.1 ATP-dependent RecD-like DNA helicase [Lachnospiraceae bacterium]